MNDQQEQASQHRRRVSRGNRFIDRMKTWYGGCRMLVPWLIFAILLIHGSLHLLGFAKAFRLAELAELSTPISKRQGLGWACSALAMSAAAVLHVVGFQEFWAAGGIAAVLSQAMIATSWRDAKFGTLGNVVAFGVAIHSFASDGPVGLRSAYDNAIKERLERLAVSGSAGDLARLPPPVQCYIRQTKAADQRRVNHLRATWRGKIRSSAEGPWMDFTAEQYNFIHEPARFFFLNASRGGIPVDVFHAYEGERASMRVRLLSLFPIVNAEGDEMTRAETVTLLNDMSILAPATLVDSGIRWEAIDEHSARAFYEVGRTEISAVLVFNDDCELVDFVSDDRLVASSNGSEFTQQRWSTPLRAYRDFGPYRLASRGEGRWHPPEGEFVYLEMELVELEINGR